MSINSRSKGKRGELEVAALFREAGYPDARRGQQYSGLHGDSDVVGVPGLHIEVKRVERLNLDKAIEQAERDCKAGMMPMVIHKRNRSKWLVTQSYDEWIKLYDQTMHIGKKKSLRDMRNDGELTAEEEQTLREEYAR